MVHNLSLSFRVCIAAAIFLCDRISYSCRVSADVLAATTTVSGAIYLGCGTAQREPPLNYCLRSGLPGAARSVGLPYYI